MWKNKIYIIIVIYDNDNNDDDNIYVEVIINFHTATEHILYL